jgi:hypothetical protein
MRSEMDRRASVRRYPASSSAAWSVDEPTMTEMILSLSYDA